MAPSFLTSVLDGVIWPASRPCRLIPEDRAPIPNGQEEGWAPQSRSGCCVGGEKKLALYRVPTIILKFAF
jgi:hypothetical protein